MTLFAFFFAAGVWLLQQQAVLPDMAWIGLPIAMVLLLHKLHGMARHVLFAALACSLGFCHAAWMAQQRLGDALPDAWQSEDITVSGVVAELPRVHERGLSFTFDVEHVLTPSVHVPAHILLSTYENGKDAPLQLHVGERWQLTVRLKQPHGVSNPYGFDFEAWMLERNLRASGYVRSDTENRRIAGPVPYPSYLIESLRENIRGHFRATLGDAPYAGVLIALAIGDQGSIPSSQWQVFTRTGVNHLMSISGLHITMLAGLAFWLAYAVWRRNPRLVLRLPARKAAAIAGLLTALTYAFLSGFSVPAQRTVYMLAAVAAALLLSRNFAVSQLLSIALLSVLLLDPWAVLSPGFWLSFGAVGLILYVTANRIGRLHWLVEYGRVQWAMLAGLIPPLLALFQQVSLVSPVANAFAIPVVEFVVTPLTLLWIILPLDGLLHLAHGAMSLCMSALEWLNRLPDAVWAQHAPPAWTIVTGILGALWILLPRGFPARWLGLLLMLPMFLVVPEPFRYGTLRMVIFDVGQGLSVLAQTGSHALLYDAGPDYPGEADSGSRILVPSLRGLGVAQLDKLMLSHDDSDHIGGALSVMQAIPIGMLSASLPGDSPIIQQAPVSQQCADGQSWDWEGVRFEVLHPSHSIYADGHTSKNNRSCTLRISSGRNSILLAADIEKESERRLLQLHPGELPATLLVAPHHGSKTSSTPEFAAAVNPRYTVFTCGYRNRFGHPAAETVSRYRALGSELLRSDEDGALIITMDEADFRLERYRRTHARYWTHKQQERGE